MNLKSTAGRSLILVALVGASLQTGCTSHRLRPGIWELSFHGQRVQLRRELPIDSREVRLLVERKDSGGGEIVEISSLDGGLKPIYGDIKVDEKGEASLQIDDQDDHFHWRMYGRIRDPENVMGELFFASARQYEDFTIEGRWGLRWLRDE